MQCIAEQEWKRSETGFSHPRFAVPCKSADCQPDHAAASIHTPLIKAGKQFAVEERPVSIYHCFLPLKLKCCICITVLNSLESAVEQGAT